MSRDWRLYLDEMLGGCNSIEEFTSGVSRELFFTNKMMYWSTIKMIEIIGEAAHHIPNDIRAQMPDVEWADIVGVRHVFVHGYFGITDDVLWDIVQNSVPRLKLQLVNFVENHLQDE